MLVPKIRAIKKKIDSCSAAQIKLKAEILSTKDRGIVSLINFLS